MRTFFTVFLLFIVATLFTSCRIMPQLMLFNNSGSLINVYVENTLKCTILNNEVASMNFPIGKVISIKTSKTNWTYAICQYPPSTYCEPRGHEKIRTQLQPNGDIFILTPSENFPLAKFSHQPNGFPIRSRQ